MRGPCQIRVASHPFLLYAGVALLFVLPALRPGWILCPLDLLNDTGAWKADASTRVPVSNRLLSDVVFQHEPWMTFARRSLAEGRIPWVNPHQGDGEPFWANPQTALFSPFSLPPLLLGTRGWAWAVFLKILVAGLGARALAMTMGASPRAALVSGLVYALSGYTILWGLHPPSSASVFLPWLAAALLALVRAPSARAVCGVVISAAACAAGGHPETLFHGSVGIGAFLVWELLARDGFSFTRGTAMRRAALGAGAAAAGILLLSATLVPFLVLVRGSRAADLRRHEPSPGFRAFAVAGQILPGFLGGPLRDELDLTALSARAENFNERSCGFVGALTLVALVASRRRLPPTFRRGLVVGAASLLLAWEIPGIRDLLRAAPLFSIAANGRFVIVFVLFASAAAGPAIEALGRLPPRRAHGAALVAGGLLLIASVAPVFFSPLRPRIEAVARAGIASLRQRGVLHDTPAAYERRLSVYLDGARATALRRFVAPGVCFVVAGLAFAGARRRALLFGAALLVELGAFGWGYLPSVPLSSVPGDPAVVRDLRRLDPDGTSCLTADEDLYPADLATRDRLHDIRTYDAIGARVASATPTCAGARFFIARLPVPGTTRVGGGEPPLVGLYEKPGVPVLPPAENRPPAGLAAGLALSVAGALLAISLAWTASRIAPGAAAP